MTGIRYQVDLRALDAPRRLADLMRRLDNPKGFYKNVGLRLKKSATDNFGAESDSEGVPWKKLMPSTIRGRISKKQTPLAILRISGGLVESINYRASEEDVRIGSGADHAAIHQLGGTIKKKARKATIQLRRNEKTGEIGNKFVKKSKSNVVQDVNIPAYTITIPARPYLGVSAADKIHIGLLADRWLND